MPRRFVAMALRKAAAPRREGGTLISQVHQLSGRLFARILKEHGVDDLNPAQGRIVYELWKQDGIDQAQLAARTKLDKSTLTLMLTRLECSGHLRRERDVGDKRRRLVRLTDKNRRMHAAYATASRAMLVHFYHGLTGAEIERFESTLRRLVANLERATMRMSRSSPR
jgi:DNA-binding MarR family transcriptional regulator